MFPGEHDGDLKFLTVRNMDIQMSYVFCLFLVILQLQMQTGEGILCWECTSLDNDWCTEYFVDVDMTPYQQYKVNCTGTKQRCMKLIAHMKDDSVFYVRTCDVSQVAPGTCMTASHVLSIPRSTVCVCEGHMCNSTSTTSFSAQLLWIFIASYIAKHQWNTAIM